MTAVRRGRLVLVLVLVAVQAAGAISGSEGPTRAATRPDRPTRPGGATRPDRPTRPGAPGSRARNGGADRVTLQGGGRRAGGVDRTHSLPETTAGAPQPPVERSLRAILHTMEENQQQLRASVREVAQLVRATHQELSELRDDTDLVLGSLYKASCEQVAQEQHDASQGRVSATTVAVYTIKPPKHKPTKVRCELDRGGVGWTVVVARSNARQSFNKTFQEYREGFGDPAADYWIGLDVLHRLTTWRPHQLRVVMEDFDGQQNWAQYHLFRVSGPEDKYRLEVGRYEADSSAGDGLQIHSGAPFSTFDKDDDDNRDGNCAQMFGGGGGWWYSNCYHVLPTGHYRNTPGNEYGGVAWYPWRNVKHSLKAMTLLIRPR